MMVSRRSTSCVAAKMAELTAGADLVISSSDGPIDERAPGHRVRWSGLRPRPVGGDTGTELFQSLGRGRLILYGTLTGEPVRSTLDG